LFIRDSQAIRREVIAHRQMKDDNVLEILGIISSVDHEMSIISPYMKDGNAIDFLRGQKGCESFLRIVSLTARYPSLANTGTRHKG
jgi:hypothetical protein